MLENRLSTVIDKIIGENQTGFIKGMNISEGIMITNEMAHSLKNGTAKGIIVKLDFEKAFDSVDWDFLLSAMDILGFGKSGVAGLLASSTL